MFRKFKGMKIPYIKQGLIYFTCMNYKSQSKDMQDRILNLCVEVGEESYPALFEVLTNCNKSVLQISMEYFVSEKRLYTLRKRFYERW